MDGLERIRQIFLDGVSGRRPRVPVDAEALEAAFRAKVSQATWQSICGGAGGQHTVRANRAAFDAWRIVPRALAGVERASLGVELFGQRLHAPILHAPIGVLGAVHRGGDVEAARGAAAAGVPMIFSSQASHPMEACAEAMGDAPRWFQLYWGTSDALARSFVRRAEACGCSAVVLTVDTTVPGWRTRDLDRAYLPFLRGAGIAQYTSDPVFRRLADEPLDDAPPRPRPSMAALRTLVRLLRNHPEGILSGVRTGAPVRAVQRFTATFANPGLGWDDLPRLRAMTDLPILLKGIVHPDDARRAVDAGMSGIVVSNHGGRQIDRQIASLDALAGVAEAVGDAVPVLFDGGIRTGADAFVALALGARAVLVGRPCVYGLALAGREGVREVLQNVAGELDVTMRLAGVAGAASIGRQHVVPAGAVRLG